MSGKFAEDLKPDPYPHYGEDYDGDSDEEDGAHYHPHHHGLKKQKTGEVVMGKSSLAVNVQRASPR